ncbi:MAG TPA: biotin/lipoyl-binding protein [Nakamurella sp.]|nr:biotin/lipoyl-binding protein [Nakamurella sp.]
MNKGRRLLTRRPWITALVVVVIAGGLAGGMWWFSGRNANATTAASGSVNRLVAASVGTIKKSITTTGALTPADQEQVNFAATGTVTAVNVTAGQTVTAGQALATVDTLQMQATLASDQATLASDQAKLVSDQDAASSDTQIAADQAAIAVAQSDVTNAQTALNSATLTSPINGIVASVNLTVGQKVTASTSSTASTAASAPSGTGSAGSGSGGTTGNGASSGGNGGSSGTGSSGGGSAGSTSSTAQFLIVGTGSWLANVTVDDSQVGLLTAGDQAELTVSGSTGTTGAAQPIFGTVQSVGLISTSTTATAAYPVVVQVTGNPDGLHDGTAVSVTLIYKQVSNVLTVPSAAVHTVNGQQVVYVMPADSAAASSAAATAAGADSPTGAGPDSSATQTGGASSGFAARAAAANVDVSAATTTVVTVGDTDGTNTEITGGLSEGDLVVVTTTVGAGRTGSGSGTGGTNGGTGGFGGTGGTGGFGGAGGVGGFGGGAGRGTGGN